MLPLGSKNAPDLKFISILISSELFLPFYVTILQNFYRLLEVRVYRGIFNNLWDEPVMNFNVSVERFYKLNLKINFNTDFSLDISVISFF